LTEVAVGPAAALRRGNGGIHFEGNMQQRKHAKKAALVFVAMLGMAHAQAPVRITLDQAIDLAIAHNHTLKAAQTQIQQNQAQEITAALRPNPNLTADTLFIPIEPQNFSSNIISNVTEFDVGVSYLFERGGKRHRRVEAARDATGQTRYQVSDAERTLMFNTAQQFVTVQLAESNLDLANQDLASFQQTVDIAKLQYKAGAISEGDLLKITVQLLQFQTDVSAAKVAKAQALATLREFLGYDAVPANYDVEGDLTYQPLELNRDDLLAKALKTRPDLLAANLGVRAAQSQYALAKANGKVDVTGGLTYSHVADENTLGVTVSLPLPIFDRNQGEIARTQYARTAAQETASAASDTVITDVNSAYEAFIGDREVVTLYTGGYLEQSKDSRDISEYAYHRGAASLLDFLDAERSYRATQLAYRQALASYLIAVEQLKEAVGSRTLP
jgi:cobalt-zinc-cadmium efflux system outer membrane protein